MDDSTQKEFSNNTLLDNNTIEKKRKNYNKPALNINKVTKLIDKCLKDLNTVDDNELIDTHTKIIKQREFYETRIATLKKQLDVYQNTFRQLQDKELVLENFINKKSNP